MNDVGVMTYEQVLAASIELDAHQSYAFCKCKSGRYLKLKGIEAKNAFELLRMVEKQVGNSRTFSYNPARKSATFTLYY